MRILRYPNPKLFEPSKPVEFVDQAIKAFCTEMLETMKENGGVGLAAIQVGTPLAIFVTSVYDIDKVYINPKVTPSGQVLWVEEGCLSVVGIFEKVPRFTHAVVTYTDLDGNPKEDFVTDLGAQVVQHEMEHLVGAFFLQHLPQVRRDKVHAILKARARKLKKEKSR